MHACVWHVFRYLNPKLRSLPPPFASWFCSRRRCKSRRSRRGKSRRSRRGKSRRSRRSRRGKRSRRNRRRSQAGGAEALFLDE